MQFEDDRIPWVTVGGWVEATKSAQAGSSDPSRRDISRAFYLARTDDKALHEIDSPSDSYGSGVGFSHEYFGTNHSPNGVYLVQKKWVATTASLLNTH